VQSILDFLDFNSFKTSILQLKAALEGGDQLIDRSKNNIDMFYKLEKEDPNDPSTGWSKKCDYNAIASKGVKLKIY